MRITRELLVKTARDTVAIKLRKEKDIVAAYMVGSALGDHPLLGGMTDIDIIFIHSDEPKVEREVQRVFDEVHLDIVHHPQHYYLQPRELRTEPWLGHAVYNHPLLLHDVRHWFEFTQASVGAQFYRPDLVIQRARRLFTNARDIWTVLKESRKSHSERIRFYLAAVGSAGNAIAVLTGNPLPNRRFGLELPQRCAAAGDSNLANGLFALLSRENLTREELSNMLPEWDTAFNAAGGQEKFSMDVHPLRRDYYYKAFEQMISDAPVESVYFPLLRTWNKAICSFLASSPEYDRWIQAMSRFHLGREDFNQRLNELDKYLDSLENLLDTWAISHGA